MEAHATGKRLLALAVVTTVSVAFTTIHVLHLHIIEATNIPLVSGALPLLLALVLLAGTVGLYYRDVSTTSLARIALWTVVGVGTMLLVGIWNISLEFAMSDITIHTLFVLANDMTAGALGGFVLGTYDAQTIRRRQQVFDMESQVAHERDRFVALFENVPNPVAYYRLVDGDPRIQSANTAFTDLFGESVVADDAGTSWAVDEPIRNDGGTATVDLAARLSASEPSTVEVERLTTDGPRTFIVYFVPHSLSESADGGFTVSVDITERIRRESRLELLNRVLRHDLRNELNIVLTASEAIIADVGDPHEQAALVRDRALSLASLSDKARQVERLIRDAGNSTEPADVHRVLRSAVDRVDDAGDITLPAADEPRHVVANGLLVVAFVNVIENAVTHVEDPTVTVTVDRDDDWVHVRIRDDGPGIPETELAVFERDRETQLEHASGLGLWLVRWIVNDAGGVVQFESDDTGTAVTLSLLAVDEQTEP
ncbi:sensor histidine kinase [Haloarchaeobius sp. DT45]|uniref:sensor histidine kinase n=1 Tax=Haloarchaeobius sp. DT45 TaxID=3446116 RepID=UPI003F6D9BA0